MSPPVRMSAFNLFLTTLLVTIAFVACSKDAARRAANESASSIDTAAVAQTPAQPPASARAASLAGLAYSALPPGVSFVSGAVIPASAGAATFDLAHVKTPNGDRLLLQTAGPKVSGAASHLVVADLALPPMGPNEQLVMASCDVNGTLDPRVVAIVTIEPGTARFKKVRQAWRADPDAKRFAIVPVDGVVCEEPGSGQ